MSVAQDGIQKLLAAEQEAQQIVAKARKGQCTRGISMTALLHAICTFYGETAGFHIQACHHQNDVRAS